MLDHFAIQGFRCFRDFKIEGLRRLNLIAGKNGLGKSALLEAMRLYQQPDLQRLQSVLEESRNGPREINT